MKALKICVIIVFLIGCVSPTDKIETKSNFKFNLDLKNIPGNVSVVRGDLLEENTLHNISFNFVIDTINETASATLTDIPVGDYRLTVSAYNDQSDLTHQATADVTISLDQTETIDLTFTEMTGDLIVNVVWPEPDTTQYVIKTFNLLFKHDTASVYSESDVSIDLYFPRDLHILLVKFKLSEPLEMTSMNASRVLHTIVERSNGTLGTQTIAHAGGFCQYNPFLLIQSLEDDTFLKDTYPNPSWPNHEQISTVENWVFGVADYGVWWRGNGGSYKLIKEIDVWFNQELYDSLYSGQKLKKQSFEQIQNMPDYLQKMMSN